MASLAFLDTWSSCVTRKAALAPFTSLKMGGLAAALVKPPDVATLSAILKAAQKNKAQVRFLGSGTNILVRDEGFQGIVIQFSAPAFQTITVKEQMVVANHWGVVECSGGYRSKASSGRAGKPGRPAWHGGRGTEERS